VAKERGCRSAYLWEKGGGGSGGKTERIGGRGAKGSKKLPHGGYMKGLSRKEGERLRVRLVKRRGRELALEGGWEGPRWKEE